MRSLYFIFTLIYLLSVFLHGVVNASSMTVTRFKEFPEATGFYQVALSPDGTSVLFGNENDPYVFFGSLEETQPLKKLTLDNDEMESGAISKDDNLVVVGGQGGFIHVFSHNGNLLWSKEFPSHGELQVAVLNSGGKIYVASHKLGCYSTDGSLLWELSIDLDGWTVWSISTTDNGERILLGTNSDVIFLDSQGVEIKRFDIVGGNNLVDSQISPDGKHFAVSFVDGGKYYVSMYDISQGEMWRQEVSSYSKIAVDNNGWVYACSGNNICSIRDLNSSLLYHLDNSSGGYVAIAKLV
jgi:Tol biopolymer transport system component